MSKQSKIILAPLHGYTEAAFRNALAECFGGYDEAIAPFIALSPAERINPARLRDVAPIHNMRLPIVPQILGNDASLFISMSKALSDLGYTQINWNMGCPKKSIAVKKRGSGLLPHPDFVDSILSEVIPNISQPLSVKLRLGRNHPDEIYPIIEILNRYPLVSVIVHPRIGVQLYDVKADVDRFATVLPLIKHPVIYNGDIFTLADYQRILTRFPSVAGCMIGRGVLANPFLAEMLSEQILPSPTEQLRRFIHFIDVLMDELKKESRSSHFLFSRMKDYWGFFAYLFNDTETVYKEMVRITDEPEFFARQETILNEGIWKDLTSIDIGFTGTKADKKELDG
jgi:tRNA-dihydrouridine synthase B